MQHFRRARIAAVILSALALASFSTAGWAQDVKESHLKAARAAITAIKATDVFDVVLPRAASALKSELIQKDPNLQELIRKTVDEKTIALAGRRADLEREAALAFARAFTEEELTTIANFYNSPAGQKLLKGGPAVTNEVGKAAEIWQRGVARDLAKSVAEVLAKEAPLKASQDAPIQPAPAPAQ
jgi:uncharacterized protein